MKETLKLVAVLTIICSISAAMLAAVYSVTMGPITEALEIKTVKAAEEVMPAGAPKVVKESIDGENFFIARSDSGCVEAVAVEGTSKNGYGGDLTLMVGLSTDKKLINFQVITSKETAGLGTRISEPDFKEQLIGKPFTSNWQVKKDGGDFDALTSATISSRAALECVRDAISKFENASAKLGVKP